MKKYLSSILPVFERSIMINSRIHAFYLRILLSSALILPSPSWGMHQEEIKQLQEGQSHNPPQNNPLQQNQRVAEQDSPLHLVRNNQPAQVQRIAPNNQPQPVQQVVGLDASIISVYSCAHTFFSCIDDIKFKHDKAGVNPNHVKSWTLDNPQTSRGLAFYIRNPTYCKSHSTPNKNRVFKADIFIPYKV